MKDLKRQIHEMELSYLYWEETKKEAIIRGEEMKKRKREFANKLIKSRS